MPQDALHRGFVAFGESVEPGMREGDGFGSGVRHQHRKHEQGHQQRGQERHRQCESLVSEQGSFEAAEKEQRREDGKGGEGGCRGGQRDLFGADGCRFGNGPSVAVTVDVFEHHDGVVDEQADAECESAQRNDVQVHIEQVHHKEGDADGDRNRYADGERQARIAKEQEKDHERQHRPDGQGLKQVFDEQIDEGGRFGEHLDLNSGKRGADVVEHGHHIPNHSHGVAAVVFFDEKGEDGAAVEQGER